MKSLSRVWLFAIPWNVGFSIHGILQARVLEWVAIAFSILVLESSLKNPSSMDVEEVSLFKVRWFYLVLKKKIDDMPLSPFLCLFNSPLRSNEAGLKGWERFELDKIEHLWLLGLLQSAPGHTASPEVPSGAWACRVSLCTSFELALWPGVGEFLAPGFMNSNITISSIQFSCSVMSDSLWLHELQHARPPCPSPTSRVYSNSCPLSGDSVKPSHLCHLLLLLPSIFPSIRVFS